MYTYPEALNAMEKIARDLCHAAFPDTQFSVSVVADSVSGTASVDWNTAPKPGSYVRVVINMPVRKATYRMSADEFAHWAAYLLHEVGHPFETDKQEWNKAVAAGKHRLLNALEDVREEKCTIDRGIAKNATKVFSDLVDMLHAKAVAGGYDPNSLQSIGWTLSTLGRHANGYAVDVSDIHAKLDPNGIVGRIVPWALDELARCRSTADCAALSEKVIASANTALKEEPKVGPTMPEPQEPQGGKSLPRGPEENEAPVSLPDVPLEKDEDEDEDEENHQGKTVEDEKPEPEPEPQPEPEPEPEPQPEEDAFTDGDIDEVDMNPTDADNLSSSGKDAATQRRVVDLLRRAIKGDAGLLDRKPVNGRDTNGSVALVSGNASKMGRQRALLARALKANEMDEYEGGRLTGRVDRRAIHKLATKTSNAVFGVRTSSDGYDTDVQILIDGSGSMGGLRILAASSLALVVAQAAAQVGVSCNAHMFTDGGLIMVTKGRNKPAGKKFAYMYNQITGGTPLSENLLLAAHLQNKRAQGKRKILFVITDGACDNGPDVVKASGQYVESLGTEIANLHIGPKTMGLFRNEVAVSVHDVSATGLRQLTAVLERGAS